MKFDIVTIFPKMFGATLGEGVVGRGVAAGLVDVKVCAVDEVWSGLKFVIPVKDRA